MTIPLTSFEPASNSAGSGLRSSGELAQFLRSGGARPMLDRLVRQAAKAAEVEFMVLGLRHGDSYEFIATHGVPLTAYKDRVPGRRLAAKLFDRDVEVEDLQKEPNFAALSVVEIAKTWRYGVNTPVPLLSPLEDGGVLALSGADRHPRKKGGRALPAMRPIAEQIADIVWLVQQIQSVAESQNVVQLVAKILLDGIGKSRVPAAIVDHQLGLIGFSKVFAKAQNDWLGREASAGQSIADGWLDKKAQAAVRTSLRTMKPIIGFDTYPANSLKPMRFDFHTIAFDGIPVPFGIFGLYVDLDRDQLAVPSVSSGWRAQVVRSDGAAPVTRFLLETLPRKRRLLNRNGQGYVALRAWAKGIKRHQLAALKALKDPPSDALIEAIADEFAEAIQSLYGNVREHVVVPVACGHSGPGCLACRAAAAVARRLGIEMVEAFAFQPQRGSSHPRTNISRAPMQIVTPATKPVLLLDDVATSGAHIEEAARLLLETAPAVLPLVWIAD